MRTEHLLAGGLAQQAGLHEALQESSPKTGGSPSGRLTGNICLAALAAFAAAQGIAGETANANDVRAGHPRLFIHKDNKAIYQQRTQDPQLAAIWAAIQRQGSGNAEEVLKSIREQKANRFWSLGWYLPSSVGNAALVCSLTGDKAYAEVCKRALLELITWETWSDKEYHTKYNLKVGLRMGRIAMAMGMAYDAAYAVMTEDERAKSREGILRLGIQPVYDEYVDGNRREFLTNWMAVNVGGAGICALAIAGDDKVKPDAMKKYIEGFVDRYKALIEKTVCPDGGYEEGVSYLSYGFEILPFFVVAAKEAAGVDFFAQTGLGKVWMFPAYMFGLKRDGYANFGDSDYECKVANHIFSMCASYTGDGHPQWFFHHGRNFVPSGGIMNFLVYNPQIKPVPPDDLPTSRVFRKFGFAALRTGWSADDIFLAFYSGPPLCHGHVAKNTFMIEAFGERLAIDLGTPGNYENPLYKTYYMRPGSHNVILVDDDTFSQGYDDTGRITEFVGSKYYDAVTGEMPTATLTQHRREIVFVKPHYFLMLDNAETKQKDRRLNWVLHPPAKAAIEMNGGKISVQMGKVRLSMTFLEPANCKARIRTGPAGDKFISVDTAELVKTGRFLTILCPQKGDAAPPAIEKIGSGDCYGARIGRKGATDYILFGKESIDYEGISCDGPKCAVTLASGSGQGPVLSGAAAKESLSFQRFAMHRATRLSCAGRNLLSASRACTAAFGSEEIDCLYGYLDLEGATDIRIAVDQRPGSVLLDDKLIPKDIIGFEGGSVRLAVPGPGRYRVRMEGVRLPSNQAPADRGGVL
ncbi:MAG: heparinase II/III family protein [Verrucomicrobia bacterium]|nr:heparinase II/III family protein [Verrucomicrobiota bacterium]MBU4291753.1 heparinase II/III family protein [Verrucomicrobiota bacterium]MBU4428603.1 heparinase II/III family protein [Verrucomicrobiota bacterium]MCG2679343.1 heparinase II/III family protein [Kiritimatiellia bacterium]